MNLPPLWIWMLCAAFWLTVIGAGRAALGCDLMGDVNGNGIVNAVDANEIQRAGVPLPPITSFDESCCDVTGNGVCNAVDAQQIQMQVFREEIECLAWTPPVTQLRNFCWLQKDARADAYQMQAQCHRGPIDFANHERVNGDRYCVELFVPLPNKMTLYAFNAHGQSLPSNSVVFLGGGEGNTISMVPIDLTPDRLQRWLSLD